MNVGDRVRNRSGVIGTLYEIEWCPILKQDIYRANWVGYPHRDNAPYGNHELTVIDDDEYYRTGHDSLSFE